MNTTAAIEIKVSGLLRNIIIDSLNTWAAQGITYTEKKSLLGGSSVIRIQPKDARQHGVLITWLKGLNAAISA